MDSDINFSIGDKVHHVDYPPSTATVVRFTGFYRVLVRWDKTGRTSEENASYIALTQ
jgi:hypothetical protein